jgi:hypothetical protein
MKVFRRDGKDIRRECKGVKEGVTRGEREVNG